MSKPSKEKKVVAPVFKEVIEVHGNLPTTFHVSLQLDKTILEGKGATMLEAIRAIPKPVKITTKSVLTIQKGDKKHSRALTIPLAQRLFRYGFQPIQARNLELLMK